MGLIGGRRGAGGGGVGGVRGGGGGGIEEARSPTGPNRQRSADRRGIGFRIKPKPWDVSPYTDSP